MEHFRLLADTLIEQSGIDHTEANQRPDYPGDVKESWDYFMEVMDKTLIPSLQAVDAQEEPELRRDAYIGMLGFRSFIRVYRQHMTSPRFSGQMVHLEQAMGMEFPQVHTNLDAAFTHLLRDSWKEDRGKLALPPHALPLMQHSFYEVVQHLVVLPLEKHLSEDGERQGNHSLAQFVSDLRALVDRKRARAANGRILSALSPTVRTMFQGTCVVGDDMSNRSRLVHELFEAFSGAEDKAAAERMCVARFMLKEFERIDPKAHPGTAKTFYVLLSRLATMLSSRASDDEKVLKASVISALNQPILLPMKEVVGSKENIALLFGELQAKYSKPEPFMPTLIKQAQSLWDGIAALMLQFYKRTPPSVFFVTTSPDDAPVLRAPLTTADLKRLGELRSAADQCRRLLDGALKLANHIEDEGSPEHEEKLTDVRKRERDLESCLGEIEELECRIRGIRSGGPERKRRRVFQRVEEEEEGEEVVREEQAPAPAPPSSAPPPSSPPVKPPAASCDRTKAVAHVKPVADMRKADKPKANKPKPPKPDAAPKPRTNGKQLMSKAGAAAIARLEKGASSGAPPNMDVALRAVRKDVASRSKSRKDGAPEENEDDSMFSFVTSIKSDDAIFGRFRNKNDRELSHKSTLECLNTIKHIKSGRPEVINAIGELRQAFRADDGTKAQIWAMLYEYVKAGAPFHDDLSPDVKALLFGKGNFTALIAAFALLDPDQKSCVRLLEHKNVHDKVKERVESNISDWEFSSLTVDAIEGMRPLVGRVGFPPKPAS